MLNVLVTFYAKCARALTFQTVSKETYYRVKRDLCSVLGHLRSRTFGTNSVQVLSVVMQ